MTKKSPTGGLVYSTDAGRMCSVCRKPMAGCICRQRQVLPKSDGWVRVFRESKGRGGKTVTLVTGLALDALALAQLGKQLKAACGSGGTVKGGVIELQGDHCEEVMQMLQQQGHSAKRAGG
ncbi:MAG: translation initiation factor Sui1 [Polaromonas sp.]